ncbi:MAG TPA: hypothetical protein VFT56_02825 [Sphingomonas sp.]|nr:hypothetical protein [Sphingomonas sp.]
MSALHNTIARRADAFARWTRLDRLTLIDRPEPRNLRWSPLAVIAAMAIGYTLLVRAENGHGGAFPSALAGALLFYVPFAAAVYMRMFGPRLVGDPQHPLDERERMVRARAGHLSGIVIAVLTISGCFSIGIGQQFGWWWTPRRLGDWIQLGMMIEAWMLMLPVLIASWLQPRAERD